MQIKIQLPNPWDYQYADGPIDWFTQMRISLKAAEKTYQEATKGLTDEDKGNFQVDIGIPYEREDDLLKTEKDMDNDPSGFIRKNLYVTIWSV